MTRLTAERQRAVASALTMTLGALNWWSMPTSQNMKIFDVLCISSAAKIDDDNGSILCTVSWCSTALLKYHNERVATSYLAMEGRCCCPLQLYRQTPRARLIEMETW